MSVVDDGILQRASGQPARVCERGAPRTPELSGLGGYVAGIHDIQPGRGQEVPLADIPEVDGADGLAVVEPACPRLPCHGVGHLYALYPKPYCGRLAKQVSADVSLVFVLRQCAGEVGDAFQHAAFRAGHVELPVYGEFQFLVQYAFSIGGSGVSFRRVSPPAVVVAESVHPSPLVVAVEGVIGECALVLRRAVPGLNVHAVQLHPSCARRVAVVQRAGAYGVPVGAFDGYPGVAHGEVGVFSRAGGPGGHPELDGGQSALDALQQFLPFEGQFGPAVSLRGAVARVAVEVLLVALVVGRAEACFPPCADVVVGEGDFVLAERFDDLAQVPAGRGV